MQPNDAKPDPHTNELHMSNREIYLDHAATTPIDPIVAETISRVQADCFANPSSPHSAGRRAHHRLDEARVKILEDFGCLSLLKFPT